MKRILLLAGPLVVLGLGVGGFWLWQNRIEAAASPPVTPATKSQFSFAGTDGWRTGPSNKTSLALFSNDHTCFTSMEYKKGVVDITAKLQKQQASLASSGGSMIAGETKVSTLMTDTGPQSYALHQFSLSSGSEKLMEGLQLGYVQLKGGYVEVQGHCNEVNQLPTTLPALQAYNFQGRD